MEFYYSRMETMSETMKGRILEKFGAVGLKRSILNLGDAEKAIAEIMAGHRYNTILEIGTYKGVSAALLSQYCDQLITIDLGHGRLEETDPGWSRAALWDYLGCKNIKLVLLESPDDKTLIVENLKFDFAFIDGAHSYDGVREDFALVNQCGRVLFHDYDDSGVPEKNYVYDFVNTLPEGVQVFDNIFALWTH